jgi:signal transduction histidine kinase
VTGLLDRAQLGTPLRVLHVEDSEDDSVLVMRELRRGGFDPSCQRVDTQAAFKAALQGNDWDVIISDYSLPRYNGLTALEDAREQPKDIPFILVSGTIGETDAVRAMRAGAHDYVLKDSLSRLAVAIEREMREASGRAAQREMGERLAISERMASTGTLAAGVAHEINNPLAVIMANLDFLTGLVAQLGANPAGFEDRLRAVEEALHDVREAAERVRAIVRDVKLFSTPHQQARGPVDVTSVIESSIRMAWNEIRHRAHLVKEYGNVPLVDSNEARLGQILLNLLVNAAQALPEGRASDNKIHVTTRVAADGRVVIEVRDTGAGIPKSLLSRIFDPFFTTKAIGVGTGLGLSLCYRMISDLDGEIAVESELGVGSVFRVTLPAATERLPAMLPAKMVLTPTRRARLLVVDDEPAIGRVLARNLEQYHEVVVLTSGKAAMARLLAGERFDAILSDLMMPEVTGMEIHDALSRSAPDQAQRMIFLTGGAFTERARQFLDRVPNPRIEKPFDVVNLLAIIAGMAK